jgi:co-chaperonin GroES (HSP10)
MKPLHNKVVIQRIENDKTSLSGIILSSSGEPDRAKVIAVGPEVTEVSVDDIVMLDWNKAIKFDDSYVITVDNIVFVYEE